MDQGKALLDMGEHSAFIWGAYGVCALVLALLVMMTLRRIRESEKTLSSLETQRRDARQGAPEVAPKDTAAAPNTVDQAKRDEA